MNAKWDRIKLKSEFDQEILKRKVHVLNNSGRAA